MKYLSFIFVFVLVTSCGNPHVDSESKNSVTPRIETQTGQTNTPEESDNTNEENPDGDQQNEQKVVFFIGNKNDKKIPEGLRTDSLNDLESGEFSDLSLNYPDLNIQFFHKTEERFLAPEINHLDSFFSEENYNLSVLAPISTDDIKGDGKGIDTLSTDALTKDVLLFQFSRPLKSFAGIFLDLESTAFMPGTLRAFDCGGNLVASELLIYPDGTDGDDGFYFIGFRALNFEICSFSVTVGDLINRTGVYKSVAVDEVAFE